MTDTNQQTASLPRRGIRQRWIVLSLLLVGLILGGMYSWKPFRRHQARQFIVASGGMIEFGDCQLPVYLSPSTPSVPPTFISTLQSQFFDAWRFRKAEAERLKHCCIISVSVARYRALSPDQMAAISQFPELKSLCLNDVLLRDEDARELRRLSALSSLTLTNCSYWGKPSAIPGVWNSLHTLTIQRSPLTPLRISQMVSLSNLPQLTVLNLSNYDLSDEDVREIQCLPSLRSLTLTNCTYSGHYSVISGELLSLHDLDLERSLLTPQTIEQLVKLRKLRNLRIRSTSSGEGQKVEEETMQRLHLALRECTIQVHDEQNRQLQHRHSFTQEAQWGEPERPNSSVNSF